MQLKRNGWLDPSILNDARAPVGPSYATGDEGGEGEREERKNS